MSDAATEGLSPLAFELDGAPVTLSVRAGESLLEVLRERLGVICVKDGCSPLGQCGACTVLIDGRPRAACVIEAGKLGGARVTTCAGLDEALRAALSRCLAATGAVQCGFCTPGLVVRAAALLGRESSPSRALVARQLGPHLCRCTGYVKIVDAVLWAARVLRGEASLPSPADVSHARTRDGGGAVGRRRWRHRAQRYALGTEPFVDDLSARGMLHGALRLSRHARARVLRIDTSAAQAIEGVAVVLTAGDVVGDRRVGLVDRDWPCFIAVGETTRMAGDVLAAVAARDRHTARKAAAAIVVEYQPLPPLCDPLEALAEQAPRVHPDRDNLLATTHYRRGDVAAALASSAHVVRQRFRTQRVEHLYLEPESCLAEPLGDGRLRIFSHGQGVYDDRRQLARLLSLPEATIEIVQVAAGGAFGGKEDLSVQPHAALLARRAGAPVKLTLSRAESIRLHPKRHPFVMDYVMGCDAGGKLTALRAELLADTGAYASVGAKVVERAAGHACGAYAVPHVEVRGRAVYTNGPPSGAMRGFGVPQVTFAVEQMLDRLAERVGLDGYQIRELNLLRDGDRFGSGQRMRHAGGLRAALGAVESSYYGSAHTGIACGIKNVGIGNGRDDIGRVRIDVLAGGRLRICHGMSEIGQGLATVAQQIAAEAAGLPADQRAEVEVLTAAELDCGMTTASRATVLVGNALRDAAARLRTDLLDAEGEIAALEGRSYPGRFVCDWTSAPAEGEPDADTHLSFGFAAQVVELDQGTGEVRRVIAAHDVGRAINPAFCEGQIEGAVHMGLGYALTEALPLLDGVPASDSINQLGVIRAHRMPEIEVILLEHPDPRGPYGARGVGEIGMVPTAAAVASALHHFDGRWRSELPMRRGRRRC